MTAATSTSRPIRTITTTMAAAATLVAGLAGCSSPAPAVAAPAANPPATTVAVAADASRVTVGTSSIKVLCTGTGTGKPAIILLAGEGDSLAKFSSLQKALSRTTRVCSYDRPGEGDSPAPATAQTLTDSATVLEDVLEAKKIDGPVVVVGHSLGGLIAATFAHQYPTRVAGVVLLDATAPSVSTAIAKLIPATATGVPAAVREEVGAFSSAATNPEMLVSDGSPVGSLGALPLTVVQHGKPIYAPVPTYGTGLQTIWATGQHQLAALSSTSRSVTAHHSGHYIYLDQPALAVTLIENATAVQPGK